LVADLDLLRHFHALADDSEVVVGAAGQVRRVPEQHEELRAVDAGRAGSHSHRAGLPGGGVGLVGQLVCGPAGAVAAGVAALEYEALHAAVEGQAVVEALLRQEDEVVDGDRRGVRVERDLEVAAGGPQRGRVALAAVDRLGWGRGHRHQVGPISILACGRGWTAGARRLARVSRIAAAGQEQDGNRRQQRPHRWGSRAAALSRTPRRSATPAVVKRAAETLTTPAIVPPRSGPRAKPRAVALALRPKMRPWTATGASRPSMAEVAGPMVPKQKPVSVVARMTSATPGATPSSASAPAARVAVAAARRR